MSRYYLRCPESDRYFAVVGWDAPLETFFAQVIDRTKLDESEREKPDAEAEYDHESVVLWRGSRHRARTVCEYESVSQLPVLPRRSYRTHARHQSWHAGPYDGVEGKSDMSSSLRRYYPNQVLGVAGREYPFRASQL